MKKKILFAFLSGWFVVNAVWGQDAVVIAPGQHASHAFSFSFDRGGKEAELAKAWQKAKSETEKAKVRKQAQKYLEQQFEADMERREKELEAVQARVERLRKQLEKRATMQEEIVELQLKQMTMGWDGLGWSSPENHSNSSNFAVPRVTPAPVPPIAAPLPHAEDMTTDLAGFYAFAPRALSPTTGVEKQMREAASEGDYKELRKLAEKLVTQAEVMDGLQVNNFIYHLTQDLSEDVKDESYWTTMGEIVERFVDGETNQAMRANLLDTAARCYMAAGDLETAMKLQSDALDANSENKEIKALYEELKSQVRDSGD